MSSTRKVILTKESWDFVSPFHISGYTFTESSLLHVAIEEEGVTGNGEAAGIYYLDETVESITEQVRSVLPALEHGLSRDGLRRLLPRGGARNAVDCALWDLEAKLSGKSIWELTGIKPGATHSVMTIGIDTPGDMGRKAALIDSNKIKVKLDNELPLERISAVCKARKDAEIVVDVNQGWSFSRLVELAPKFRDLGVAMIEQPLPRGADEELEGYDTPLTLCADESCLDTSEFEQAARRYQMINIKLDKTGGLTEALDLAAMARARGIELMVGNMTGTSLGMAPGYVIAQLCRFVDLDGALFLRRDREHAMSYGGGLVSTPRPELWG
jgi:L-alanine-DL-glutamate epimerase-like enolase superfamily enzyme